jgi:hypothetical protein
LLENHDRVCDGERARERSETKFREFAFAYLLQKREISSAPANEAKQSFASLPSRI